MTAFRPDPQTLLIVVAFTVSGSPAPFAAWRAGAWPRPAVSTFPMITSSTVSGWTFALCRASLITMLPRTVALRGLNTPFRFPIGVRTAPAITTCLITHLLVTRLYRSGLEHAEVSWTCGMRWCQLPRNISLKGWPRQVAYHDAILIQAESGREEVIERTRSSRTEEGDTRSSLSTRCAIES